MDVVTIIQGDCREVMAGMDAESVDAVVTDPPYELGFMGKKWDSTGIATTPATWEACWRVLKPGGYLLAFGGSRTFHRIAVAIEDAGFEIRDTLSWLYGSGFPKSLDVSKAIDKAAGAEREVIGRKEDPRYNYDFPDSSRPYQGKTNHNWKGDTSTESMANITAPATPEAEQWQGWGTALKPAWEPIIMARKPLAEKTVAKNVLAYGTGAINVDACRIGLQPSEDADKLAARTGGGGDTKFKMFGSSTPQRDGWDNTKGRWPANVVLDEVAAEMVGESSRFFYTAKASRSERNAGLEGMPECLSGNVQQFMTGTSSDWIEDSRSPNGGYRMSPAKPSANSHPTVKPISLMRWLVRMVTPPGGTILDPFAGSGTTGVAATEEGFSCILIEQEAEYLPIIEARISHAHKKMNQLPIT